MLLSEFLFLLFGGLLVSPALISLNMTTGTDALDYYGEVHLSSWNSWMHTIGMPFTVYGISCWFPAIFGMKPEYRNVMQKYIWTMLFVHYMGIDLLQGLFCTLFYSPVMYFAYNSAYSIKSNSKLFWHGLLISFFSLLFQEVVGHWYGGDDPSRVEGVPNAIMYATLYSTYHIF